MYKYLLFGIIVLYLLILLDVFVFIGSTKTMDEHILNSRKYDAVYFPSESYIRLTPEYNHNVAKGYSVMKTKTIVICALARNVASKLELNRERLESWGNKFKDYRVVIYENDSTDSTRKDLLNWQASNDKVIIIPCGLSDDPARDCIFNEKTMYEYGFTSTNRMAKMSKMRNIYLDYVKTYLKDFDYLMVYDIDISGPMNMDGMAIPFGNPYQWDAICANGVMPMPGTGGLSTVHYDSLPQVEVDQPYEINQDKGIVGLSVTFLKTWLNSNLYPDRPLYPVKSAFGGATIYNMKAIRNPYVMYREDYGCEHIYLHKSMADQGYGRIFINPAGLILVGRQGPGITSIMQEEFHRFLM
jgi:hypothetical protein